MYHSLRRTECPSEYPSFDRIYVEHHTWLEPKVPLPTSWQWTPTEYLSFHSIYVEHHTWLEPKVSLPTSKGHSLVIGIPTRFKHQTSPLPHTPFPPPTPFLSDVGNEAVTLQVPPSTPLSQGLEECTCIMSVSSTCCPWKSKSNNPTHPSSSMHLRNPSYYWNTGRTLYDFVKSEDRLFSHESRDRLLFSWKQKTSSDSARVNRRVF